MNVKLSTPDLTLCYKKKTDNLCEIVNHNSAMLKSRLQPATWARGDLCYYFLV